jgi:hypothetical protein
MGRVRSDFAEVRVLPTLDYSGVAPGQVIDVPDENVYHWVAGGFTPLDSYPVPYHLYPNHSADPLAVRLPDPNAPIADAVPAAPIVPPPLMAPVVDAPKE